MNCLFLSEILSNFANCHEYQKQERKDSLSTYLPTVSLPLLGSFVAGAFGRFLGSKGTAIVTITRASFSFTFSLTVFHEVALGASACYIKIAPWISLEMFDASWGFLGDREVTG